MTFSTSGNFTLANNLSAASNSLGAFTISSPLIWNAGNITTGTGAITINGDVTLGGSSVKTLTTTSGPITLGTSSSNIVTGNAIDLTINSGSASATINSTLNNIGILGLGTLNQTGPIYVLSDVTAAGLVTGNTSYDISFADGASGSTNNLNIGSSVNFTNKGSLNFNS